MRNEKVSEAAIRQALLDTLPRLWRFALSLSGAPDRADDLVQATSIRALERAQQVQDLRGIDSWFLTICRSIWLNDLRAQTLRRAQSLQDVPEADLGVVNETGETNFFASQVFVKVMELPEAQRAVVNLVLIEGYAYREAAEILGVPVGTIMSRLHAARRALRAGLQLDEGKDAEQ